MEQLTISRQTEPWQRGRPADRLSSFDPSFFPGWEYGKVYWDRTADSNSEVKCEVTTVYPLDWGSSRFKGWFVTHLDRKSSLALYGIWHIYGIWVPRPGPRARNPDRYISKVTLPGLRFINGIKCSQNQSILHQSAQAPWWRRSTCHWLIWWQIHLEGWQST